MRATVVRTIPKSLLPPAGFAGAAVAQRAQVALAIGLVVFCLFGMRGSPTAGHVPTALALKIDPNRASAEELRLLPGVGPQLASNIIRYREQSAAPAFRTPADLDRVSRIGPATVARLTPFLKFPAEFAIAEDGENP